MITQFTFLLKTFIYSLEIRTK